MKQFPSSFNTSRLGGFISTKGTGVFSSKYGKLAAMERQLRIVLRRQGLSKPADAAELDGSGLFTIFINTKGTLGIMTEAACKIYPLPGNRSKGTVRTWLYTGEQNVKVMIDQGARDFRWGHTYESLE